MEGAGGWLTVDGAPIVMVGSRLDEQAGQAGAPIVEASSCVTPQVQAGCLGYLFRGFAPDGSIIGQRVSLDRQSWSTEHQMHLLCLWEWGCPFA